MTAGNMAGTGKPRSGSQETSAVGTSPWAWTPDGGLVILLLSTSDTDLLAAQSSGADYRCANPSRVTSADLPTLLADVNLAVVRLLGGRATWPEGLASVLGSGVPVVVLGGESSPDAELMATSTVPAGTAQEALGYLV